MSWNEEVLSFQESTPRDQLISCNSAGQRELDSGTVSQRPIDNMEGSRVWGQGERTAGSMRMFGDFSFDEKSEEREEAIPAFWGKLNKADLEISSCQT